MEAEMHSTILGELLRREATAEAMAANRLRYNTIQFEAPRGDTRKSESEGRKRSPVRCEHKRWPEFTRPNS